MTAFNEKMHTTPFPYFGGKRTIAAAVWQRLGRPKQYIEPFCGGAAVLLAAPSIASLEVIGDQNFYIANFWRCVKFQPDAVYAWQDYPVSHVDIDARHRWLTDPGRTAALREALADAEWPGDPQIAGWWVWGQCCWIGDGWCEARREARGVGGHGSGVGEEEPVGDDRRPHITTPGMGTQALEVAAASKAKPGRKGLKGGAPAANAKACGKRPCIAGTVRGAVSKSNTSAKVDSRIPSVGCAGRGVISHLTTGKNGNGKKPHLTDAGRGVQGADLGAIPHVGNGGMGVVSRVPFLSSPGQGVTMNGVASKRPGLSKGGLGVQSQVPAIHTGKGVASVIPYVGGSGKEPQSIAGGEGWTGAGVQVWFRHLAERLARVRIIHGDWTRCLNHYYGAELTAIFFDPPYKSYEHLYGSHGGKGQGTVAGAVEEWCRSSEAAGLRIALCGHKGDYDLPGWDLMPWSRAGNTYGSKKTKDAEVIWFSPGCLPAHQGGLFD